MRINKSLIAYTPTSGAGSGSVTSVALSAPTGFTVSGSPITTSGTLSLAFTTGYGIPPLMTGNSGKFLTTNGTTMSWTNIAGTDVTGAAISTSNDTNILITASGNTTNALLRTLTLTTGWTGQLAVGRGGTGVGTLTGVVIGNATSNMTAVAGTAGQFLRRNTANTAYEFRTLQGGDIAGSELTKTDDTNVTLSLSGTPASSLLQPVTIGLGWTGTLAVARGGIGVGTITGVMIGNGTSAVTGVTGTANQILRRNAGNTAYEFWTANYMTNPMTLEGSLIYATTGGTPAELFANSTSTRKYLSQINGGAPTWEALSFPTGSGTTNYVAKWTNSTTLGDSIIFDNGSNVGIGDPAPTVLLDAYKSTFGIIRVRADDGGAFYVANSLKNATIAAFGDAGGIIGVAANATAMIYAGNVPLVSYVNGAERARITTSGDFGIGTNSPAYKLDVNGNANVTGTIYAGNVSATNGSIILQDNYSSGHLTNFGTSYSSGAPVIGFGVTPSTSTYAAFLSATNLTSYPRSAIVVDSDIYFYTGAAQTVAVGSSASMLEVMRITNAGTLQVKQGDLQLPTTKYITWGGAYGTDIPTISGTSGGGSNGFLQFYPAGSTSGVKMALRRTGQLALSSYTTSTSFTGTAVATLAVTNAGDVITIAPSQTTASGTYTPTWTGLANVGSVTAFSCQYMRVGDTVTVSGWVTIDAVTDNTPTSLSFSLPINSDTSVVNRLNGTGVQQGGGVAACLSGYGTNFGEFEVIPSVDTAVNYSFHFTYRII